MITAGNNGTRNVVSVASDANSLAATNNELIDLQPDFERHVQEAARFQSSAGGTCRVVSFNTSRRNRIMLTKPVPVKTFVVRYGLGHLASSTALRHKYGHR